MMLDLDLRIDRADQMRRVVGFLVGHFLISLCRKPWHSVAK
jgi:hypothetical protein